MLLATKPSPWKSHMRGGRFGGQKFYGGGGAPDIPANDVEIDRAHKKGGAKKNGI